MRSGVTREWTLADRWHSIAIHLLRRVRHVDERSGLGRAQLSALSVIVFLGPLTLGALAKNEGVARSAITRVVRDLVAAGYARTTTDPRDRRISRVDATEAGKRLLHAARRSRLRELERIFSPLDQREAAVLDRAAEALERRLGDRHPRAPG